MADHNGKFGQVRTVPRSIWSHVRDVRKVWTTKPRWRPPTRGKDDPRLGWMCEDSGKWPIPCKVRQKFRYFVMLRSLSTTVTCMSTCNKGRPRFGAIPDMDPREAGTAEGVRRVHGLRRIPP